MISLAPATVAPASRALLWSSADLQNTKTDLGLSVRNGWGTETI